MAGAKFARSKVIVARAAIGYGRLGAVLKERFHAQFRLLENRLTVAGEADTALEGAQRLLKAEGASLHLLDKPLELREGFFEVDGSVVRTLFDRIVGCVTHAEDLKTRDAYGRGTVPAPYLNLTSSASA